MSVDKALSATNMSAVICGVPISTDAAGNVCAASSIAAPDNVDLFRNQLIIAEDSDGRHVNNRIWYVRVFCIRALEVRYAPCSAHVGACQCVRTRCACTHGLKRSYTVRDRLHLGQWDTALHCRTARRTCTCVQGHGPEHPYHTPIATAMGLITATMHPSLYCHTIQRMRLLRPQGHGYDPHCNLRYLG